MFKSMNGEKWSKMKKKQKQKPKDKRRKDWHTVGKMLLQSLPNQTRNKYRFKCLLKVKIRKER